MKMTGSSPLQQDLARKSIASNSMIMPLWSSRRSGRDSVSLKNYMKSLGPEQILNSFLTNNFDTLYELCSSGQSGSLFYYTKDKKYMMKTIPEREFKKFLEVLEPYY